MGQGLLGSCGRSFSKQREDEEGVFGEGGRLRTPGQVGWGDPGGTEGSLKTEPGGL